MANGPLLKSDPRWFDSCKMTISRKRPPSLRILGWLLTKGLTVHTEGNFQVVFIL